MTILIWVYLISLIALYTIIAVEAILHRRYKVWCLFPLGVSDVLIMGVIALIPVVNTFAVFSLVVVYWGFNQGCDRHDRPFSKSKTGG